VVGAGRNLGVVPDLLVPSILPHSKLPSARAVKDPVTGTDAIILSTENAEKISVTRRHGMEKLRRASKE
jgi:hypothetical protein